MAKFLFALLLLLTLPAAAEPLLYRVEGDQGVVWLAGAVHSLRAPAGEDDRLEAAYVESNRVVFEVAPDEMHAGLVSAVLMPLAKFEDGQQLRDAFDGAEYARAKQGLAALGLDIEQYGRYEPWFLAVQVVAMHLARHGYSNGYGIDSQYWRRALTDGKPTGGLETVREQLDVFDSLPLAEQKDFLLEALESTDTFKAEMDQVTAQWQHGDEAELATSADQGFAATPALRRALLSSRNRRWMDGIDSMLQKSHNTLVIVGALHLVGDEGLVTMLREAGYQVNKVDGTPLRQTKGASL